jgi:hypothetical protein
VTVNAGSRGSFTLNLTTTKDGCTSSPSCTRIVVVDCPCRVTGGGNDGRTPPNSWASESVGSNGNFYTFGGQVGAPTASQPQPYGEWTHRQHNGPGGSFTFHAGTASAPAQTKIELVDCSDSPACRPANNPAPTKKIDFRGIGAFKNMQSAPSGAPCSPSTANNKFYAFEVHVEDLGEPGSGAAGPQCPAVGFNAATGDCSCPDFYRIRIHCTTDHNSPVLYEAFGYIDGGNLQIHKPVGG